MVKRFSRGVTEIPFQTILSEESLCHGQLSLHQRSVMFISQVPSPSSASCFSMGFYSALNESVYYSKMLVLANADVPSVADVLKANSGVLLVHLEEEGRVLVLSEVYKMCSSCSLTQYSELLRMKLSDGLVLRYVVHYTKYY